MSMPQIPDMNTNINVTRGDAVNMIIASIAMEELSIAHILNAEGEKLQYVLGTLNDNNPGEITMCDIMAVNNSIHKTLRNVIKAEMILQLKLEDATELAEIGEECELTIGGQKIWRDGNNIVGKRPKNVLISLLRDGEPFRTAIVNSQNDWIYTFRCLPVWSASGNEHIYTVDETGVLAGYTKTISGFNVINTIEPGNITITGTKRWENDVVTDRPQNVTINLLQNGNQIDTKTIPSQDNPATFSFENVPQFNSEGTPFVYTVTEGTLTDYVTNIDGFNITNTHE